MLKMFEIFLTVGIILEERSEKGRKVRHRIGYVFNIEDVPREFSKKIADII
jgi:hypothetical protein